MLLLDHTLKLSLYSCVGNKHKVVKGKTWNWQNKTKKNKTALGTAGITSKFEAFNIYINEHGYWLVKKSDQLSLEVFLKCYHGKKATEEGEAENKHGCLMFV